MNTIEKGTVAKGTVAKGELNLSDFATTGVVGIKITSGNLASIIAENSGADQVIYTATAEDPDGGTTGFTFSLTSNSDSAVSINSSTGVVNIANIAGAKLDIDGSTVTTRTLDGGANSIIDLGSSGQLIFYQNSDGDFNGTFDGQGTLTKRGSSDLRRFGSTIEAGNSSIGN